MLRIVLSGSNGRMGRAVTELVSESENLRIIAGISRDTEAKTTDFPLYKDCNSVKGNADVTIDFSHYSTIDELVKCSLVHKRPLVVCTTAIPEETLNLIEKASKKIPIFVSGNTSIGIHLMRQLVEQAAKVLQEGFDLELIEKHHRNKLDSPSGTAYMIAETVKQQIPYLKYTYGREGKSTKREQAELGIHSVRGGSIVGEHQMIFAGAEETLEIKHRAESRRVFAYGALEAAKFLVNMPAGLYDMNDLVTNLK